MKIHYSVLILFLIYLFTNLYVSFFIFFACIIIHELAHFLFIVLFGGKVNKIELHIFGGRLDCVLPKISLTQEVIIGISGIVANFILLSLPINLGKYDEYYRTYNRLLIVFNLLPIAPLDGFRILDSFARQLFRPAKAFAFTSAVSLLGLIVLFIYSLMATSLGLILISVFLFIKNIERIKTQDAILLKNMIRMFT